MKKFIYRKNMVLVGRILEETATHIIIATKEDTHSLEKELTVVTELETKELKTKKDFALAIQNFVEENNVTHAHYVRYFGKNKTVSQMLSYDDKKGLQRTLEILNRKYSA